MDEKKRKILGYIYIGGGAVFLIAGLVFFVLNNWVNLYAQKVRANIVSRCDVTVEDGTKYQLLEINYWVGNDLISTTMESYEELPEDKFEVEVYYNVKQPKAVLNAGWTFWPLLVSVLGIVVMLPGLSYLGFLNIGLFEPTYVSPYASEKRKKLVKNKERLENSLFPFLGSLGIVVFGIVLIVLHKGWYKWIFLVGGIIVTVYFLLDLIPAVIEWIQMRSIAKVKVEVIEMEEDDAEPGKIDNASVEELLEAIDEDDKKAKVSDESK